MARDLLVNLLAAGLAFLLGLGTRSGVEVVRSTTKSRLARKNRHRRHPRYTAAWLLTYYLKNHNIRDLYMIECDGRSFLTPFITKPKSPW